MATVLSQEEDKALASDIILEVKNLHTYFPISGGLFGKTAWVKAVDGVSFDLRAGETLGIVGESGCGKSTLGRSILQLIKPTSGSVLWMGQDLCHAHQKEMRHLRRDLQIIFQDPLASLDPRMTVGKIISEPLKANFPDMKVGERREKVKSMMERVGLRADMINRYPHEFSGGQAQRIGIARAMVLEPKLIVCDEPVSALDVSIQAQVINLLQGLQKEFGLTLVFISHDLSVVRHISHRILVLYLGKAVELASPDLIYTDPLHPYTKALISAVPLPDPRKERTRQRLMLTGDLPSPLNPPSGCRFRSRCPMAQKLCSEVEPIVRELKDGHEVACHFAED